MNMLVFSVRDVKLGTFDRPFFVASRGAAVRGFADAVVDASCPLNKHPEDYQLFCLGEYNPLTGDLIPISPEFMHNATEFVK
jgi:hypothetical protein